MPTLSERRAKLEADLAKLKAKEEKEINGKFIVVGQAILAAMDDDENLKKQLDAIIDQYVTRNPDRELMGLEKRASNRGRPRKNTEAVQA